MSHLSSQPPEIKAEKLSQSPRWVGSAWAREKRFADVFGRRMAYIARGVDWIRAKAPFRSRVLCSWRTKKPGKEEGAFDDAYWMRFSPQLATGFLVRYAETGETAEQKLVHAPGRGRARLPR